MNRYAKYGRPAWHWLRRQPGLLQIIIGYFALASLFIACVAPIVLAANLVTGDEADASPTEAAEAATATDTEEATERLEPTSTPLATTTDEPVAIDTPPTATQKGAPASDVTPTMQSATAPTASSEPLAPPPASPVPEPDRTEAQVLEVIDGDTIRVSIGGSSQTVRLIGVDTPETVDPNEPVMCYGAEATAFTRDMIERAGGRVLLEMDVSETDNFGRLLRYVWLPHPDGIRFLNEELVKQGFAQASTFPPDVKYADLFAQRTREARDAGTGLWGSCGEFGLPATTATPVPRPTATPTPVPPPPPTEPPPPAQNCHPSYPDVCIPPPPPDLNCDDVPYTNFRVVGSDPHGFDREGDGLGCEG